MPKDTSQPAALRVYQQIREILIQSRSRALLAVNTEMVASYGQIGRYVLEFAGIRQNERFPIKDLESALIDKLQQFLLELGKGFAFMARPRVSSG